MENPVCLAVQAQYFARDDGSRQPRGEMTYSFFVDGSFLARSKLDTDTKRALLGRLYELADEAGVAGWSDERRQVLESLGQRLFTLLLPTEVRRAVFGPDATSPLILDVQDHDIPWELLHDGSGFVAKRLALARHLIRPRVARSWQARKKVRVLVVGDPTGDLPQARAEAIGVADGCKAALDELRDRFRLESEVTLLCAEEATKSRVLLDILMEPTSEVDIFHYAGHARFNARDPDQSGLSLSDGDLRGFEARSMVGAPLVFANGCRAGRGDDEMTVAYGAVSGLAADFVAGGALGYLAPMWAVRDSVAQQFAAAFYAAVIGGETIGQAVLTARNRVDDVDALAYVYYGDVAGHLPVFQPDLTAGPYVNDLGVQRIIELEREYAALELLAVNDLPWILWDEQDILEWTARIPINADRRARVADALIAYVEEFGEAVTQGPRHLLAIVNARTLGEYLRTRGRSRWDVLSAHIDNLSASGRFALVLADTGDEHIEEIELVSKHASLPPRVEGSVYVFNKQTRFEQSHLTYNLFEDYNADMIEHYWQRYEHLLGRSLSAYGDDIDVGHLGPETFEALSARTRPRLLALAMQALGAGDVVDR